MVCKFYRKMQAGEVGASNSDILTDKADDDANPGKDTDRYVVFLWFNYKLRMTKEPGSNLL